MKIEAEDVVRYLRDQPDFFEQHLGVLLDLKLPNLHDEKTISISEYQVAALREKNALLEAKLRELVQFGEENDALGERVHRFSLALLTTANLEALLRAIYYNLREDFAIPHIGLRLWHFEAPAASDLAEFAATSNELHLYVGGLAHPSCGTHALYETGTWFGEDGERLKSFAMVALRTTETFGLLVLASEDPERFYQGMGTLYLQRLGELISVALERYLAREPSQG
ncbi:MAG: DUF484 family protein [Burkholderiales bacterium]